MTGPFIACLHKLLVKVSVAALVSSDGTKWDANIYLGLEEQFAFNNPLEELTWCWTADSFIAWHQQLNQSSAVSFIQKGRKLK